MAKHTVQCPQCGASYNIDESKLGKRGRCAKCRNSFTLALPDPSPEEPSVAEVIEDQAAAAGPSDEDPKLFYMECVRPSGDGLCSDNACPCGYPGATIPRGSGYLYISEDVVEFRRDALSLEDTEEKIQRVQQQMRQRMSAAGVMFTNFRPIPLLVCETAAKKRGLDLAVAAADAKHFWETGRAPLRPTPLASEAESLPPPPPQTPKAVQVGDASMGRSRDQKLAGIGGWLILPAIGLVISPILIIVELIVSMGLIAEVSDAGYGEVHALNMAVAFGLLIFIVYAAVNFFGKRSTAPRIMITFYVVQLCVIIMLGLIEYGTGAEAYAEATGTPQATGRSLIAAAIWIPYFKVSRRVKATFVN